MPPGSRSVSKHELLKDITVKVIGWYDNEWGYSNCVANPYAAVLGGSKVSDILDVATVNVTVLARVGLFWQRRFIARREAEQLDGIARASDLDGDGSNEPGARWSGCSAAPSC